MLFYLYLISLDLICNTKKTAWCLPPWPKARLFANIFLISRYKHVVISLSKHGCVVYKFGCIMSAAFKVFEAFQQTAQGIILWDTLYNRLPTNTLAKTEFPYRLQCISRYVCCIVFNHWKIQNGGDSKYVINCIRRSTNHGERATEERQ